MFDNAGTPPGNYQCSSSLLITQEPRLPARPGGLSPSLPNTWRTRCPGRLVLGAVIEEKTAVESEFIFTFTI
jgi:hypothetical protein